MLLSPQGGLFGSAMMATLTILKTGGEGSLACPGGLSNRIPIFPSTILVVRDHNKITRTWWPLL
jgi:hypothetical protein